MRLAWPVWAHTVNGVPALDELIGKLVDLVANADLAAAWQIQGRERDARLIGTSSRVPRLIVHQEAQPKSVVMHCN